MKTRTITAAAALLALVSCAKYETPSVNQPEGKPMTIMATIGGDDTKITFSEDMTGLKGSWDAEEAISVVSCDAVGRALAYDIFTSVGEAGRRTAEFTGTITSTGASYYVCYYPAMYPSDTYPFESPRYYDASNVFVNSLWVRTGDQYSEYFNCSIHEGLQESNGDPSFLADRVILYTRVNDPEKLGTVQFKHLLTVFRLELTLPENSTAKTVSSVDLCTYTGDEAKHMFSPGSWSYINGSSFGSGSSTCELYTYFGVPGNVRRGIPVPADRKVVGYCMGLVRTSNNTLQPGDFVDVAVYALDADNSMVMYSRKFPVKSEKRLERGAMYTISATLE